MNMLYPKHFPWNKKKEIDAATFKPSLIDDYRDPPIVPIVKIKRKIKKKDEPCAAISSDSVRNVKSITYLYDHLRNLCINPEPRFIMNKTAILEKSRILTLMRPPLTDRKKRRLLTKKEEWLLDELEEDGFIETLTILKTFIEVEKKMIEAQAYFFDSKSLDKIPLSQNPHELEFLARILKFREYYRTQGDAEKEFSLMLYIAMHYQQKDDTWLWIVYELYVLALQAVVNYKSWDSNYCEASVRYLFGRVLLERMMRLDDAFIQLTIAYDLSLGKPWSTTCITDVNHDLIHKNSAFLIYIIQLLRCEKWASEDPQFALECIKDGVNKIINTGTTFEIIEAMMELAIMYNRIHQPERAIVILLDLTQNFKGSSAVDNENLCYCYLYLAFCYRRMKMPRKAFEYLEIMFETATMSGIKALQAQALKHLGEYYLSKKMFKTARNYFRKCKKLFKMVRYAEQMEEVSILQGYAKAVLHFPDFCQSIVNGVTPMDEDFARICYWMEYGTSFWKTRDPTSDIEIEITPNAEEEQTIPHEESSHDPIEIFEPKEMPKSEHYHEYMDIETSVQTKDDGIPIYLAYMNDYIILPGNKEEAIDLTYVLNCYLPYEHRFKIIEKIDEVKFVRELLEAPFEPPKTNIRIERKTKICIEAESSAEEDDVEEFTGCENGCVTLRPVMQMKDAKLPNKIYLIDLLNQQRMLCNESYILTKLPKRHIVLIPYSPNLFRLVNSFSSEETDHLYIISPYKNLVSKICKDLKDSDERFTPHSLLNESKYNYSLKKAGRVGKKEVTDITPFFNIFKGKMESIRNKIIDKHNMLTEEAKKKHRRPE